MTKKKIRHRQKRRSRFPGWRQDDLDWLMDLHQAGEEIEEIAFQVGRSVKDVEVALERIKGRQQE